MLNYVRQFIKIRVVFHTLYIWNEDGDPQFFLHIWHKKLISLTAVKILKKSIEWKIFAWTSLSLRALCCLALMKKQNNDFNFFRSMYNKTIIRFGFCDNLSLRLWLITPTSTSIILDITKTSSNNCLKFASLIPSFDSEFRRRFWSLASGISRPQLWCPQLRVRFFKKIQDWIL